MRSVSDRVLLFTVFFFLFLFSLEKKIKYTHTCTPPHDKNTNRLYINVCPEGFYCYSFLSSPYLPLAWVCDRKFICPFLVPVYLFRFLVKQTDSPCTRIYCPGNTRKGRRSGPAGAAASHVWAYIMFQRNPSCPTCRRSCEARAVFLQRIARKFDGKKGIKKPNIP